MKNQFLFHKQSIKIIKKKKYKNPLNNGQAVRKFTLPKEYEKDFYLRQKARLEKREQQAKAQAKPKDVNIGDILSNKNTATNAQEEELKTLNLPGGRTTAQHTASASAAATPGPMAAASTS